MPHIRERVQALLGGAANVTALGAIAGRLVATVDDASRVDEAGLLGLGMRGVAWLAPRVSTSCCLCRRRPRRKP